MTYRSLADLGGVPNEQPVVPEPEGNPFHAHWESRVHALTVAMGATGCWNLDMSRAAREVLPDYRSLSYYQIWFEGLQRLLLAHALVTVDELAAGRPLAPARALPRVLAADRVATTLAAGAPTLRAVAGSPRYAVGTQVRLRPEAASHHTRLPGYARGRRGIVERLLGAHVYPDAHSQGLGERPQWLYTVVFSEPELWGERESPQQLSVSIDAWEPYLEPA